MKTIIVSRQFSKRPLGRYLDDGETSGQAFRQRLLLPALQSDDEPVQIVLDGVAGYPSSFLEEAFGGLVREDGFAADEIRKRLKFSYQDQVFATYVDEIWHYVEEADTERSIPA